MWQNLHIVLQFAIFATEENRTMIGETLKQLREANNYKQEDVSDYLGIKRSTYSNYETGDREAPLMVLEKLANLYGCDLYDLECEDKDVLQGVIACAFRVDSLSVEDMKQVAAFKQLVMNYVKMKKIAAK
jgi:transcriptional regulator with XRE-family HTH domain